MDELNIQRVVKILVLADYKEKPIEDLKTAKSLLEQIIKHIIERK